MRCFFIQSLLIPAVAKSFLSFLATASPPCSGIQSTVLNTVKTRGLVLRSPFVIFPFDDELLVFSPVQLSAVVAFIRFAV